MEELLSRSHRADRRPRVEQLPRRRRARRRSAPPGRRVPEDVAVVCFDDNDYAAIVYPFLTVVATPAESFGTIATQLLLERIAGRAPERPRVVILPPELIVRVSCGATADGAPTTVGGCGVSARDELALGRLDAGRTAPLRKMKSP